jgi:polyisoprenoid-binding protein YceI
VTRYTIASRSSELSAAAKSSVHPIHSRTDAVGGWIDAVVTDGVVDVAQPASARIEVATDSLKADNPLVSRKIQKRLDARRHPSVVADIDQVNTGTDGRYEVQGKLSLRHVTHPFTAWAELVSDKGNSVEIAGGLILDVRDYQLDPPKILGFRVYPEVTVTVRITATAEQ